MRRVTPWILLVALAAVVGHGCGAAGDEAPEGASTARVVRVVDGDTLLVTLHGRRERVRYIGVDTPESVKPGTPVQCYAKRAAAENRRLVAGREVRLAGDREARDRYGRLLAYVYREPDGLFVNAALLRGGFARTLEIAPNTRYAAAFAALARGARTSGRGLWHACGR